LLRQEWGLWEVGAEQEELEVEVGANLVDA
jgi:hypothetical protein